MKREIKFRGIGKNSKEWVYSMTVAKGTIKRKRDWFYLEVNGGWIGVDGKTLGQFTGLKDKNGKEIYEGDIVKSEYKCLPEINIIEWFLDGYVINPHRQNLHDFNEDIEIIGTIHENPELLK